MTSTLLQSAAPAFRVSCRHHGRRWKWTTEDQATGEVCDECLRVVVLRWSDISTLVCVASH